MTNDTKRSEEVQHLYRRDGTPTGVFLARQSASHQSPADALRSLSAFMQSDPGLAWSWHCNVAMAAQDAGAPQKEANERAADFMARAFDVDTSKPPYQSPAEQELPASSVSAASVSPSQGGLGSEASDVQQPAPAAGPSAVEVVKQEIFDLFARYGSGDYTPTEEEKEILHAGLDTVLEELAALDRLRAENEQIRDALAGQDYASLPSDYPTVRMAHTIRAERDKYLHQVRDTCQRAERAEAALAKGVVVPIEELDWMAAQYDDTCNNATLSGRLYDVSCTAKKLLAAAKEGK